MLNVFADSSREDLVGTMTATSLTGLDMGGPLNFTLPAGSVMPFGEPTTSRRNQLRAHHAGGGADPHRRLDEHDRGAQRAARRGQRPAHDHEHAGAGPDRNPDGTPGPVAAHGGITTVHGGGTSRLEVRGTFTVNSQAITRTDGVT